EELLDVPGVGFRTLALVNGDVVDLVVHARKGRRRRVLPVRHSGDRLDAVDNTGKERRDFARVGLRSLVLVNLNRLHVLGGVDTARLSGGQGRLRVKHGEDGVKVPTDRIRASGARSPLSL